MATFKEAFRAARNAGKKEFSWNGKSYNTKLAPDAPKGPRARPAATSSVSGPKARPKASAPTTGPKPRPSEKPVNAYSAARSEAKAKFASPERAAKLAEAKKTIADSKLPPAAKQAQEGKKRIKEIRDRAYRLDAMSKARDIRR